MEILAESVAVAVINAPMDRINLTEWLFTLKDHEYQACSQAHIAGAASVSPDGKRISLNVEKIGDSLLVQHYIETISRVNHCEVNSISDSFSPVGKTTIGVQWELRVRSLGKDTCELNNHVVVSMTEAFSTMLEKAGVTDTNPIKVTMQQHLEAHNKEETPLFAKDIERKAKLGIWQS